MKLKAAGIVCAVLSQSLPRLHRHLVVGDEVGAHLVVPRRVHGAAGRRWQQAVEALQGGIQQVVAVDGLHVHCHLRDPRLENGGAGHV